MKRAILTLSLCVAGMLATAQSLYKDVTRTPEERAADLVSRLTLEEKVSLMMDVSPAIPRLGIPQFQWWNETLHGVGRNGTATVFPITMAMAASWNDALVQQCFSAASDEARAKAQQAKASGNIQRYQCLSFWTPNINIFRDPRWGRGQETYGEDPFLTSRMGVSVVKGLQGEPKDGYLKTLACGKHFAVHSGPEWNRHQFNVENLPLRDLWETYLPAFKALVQEADVQEIMCAYQRNDGEPCCGNNRYLQQILRQELGFKGLVTSDCGAIDDFFVPGRHGFTDSGAKASAIAVRAGTDVECGNAYRHLPEAVRKGLVTEAELDASLKRLFVGRIRLGDLDPDSIVPWTKIPSSVIASPEHRALALEAARQGIVLLKNDGILPLGTQQRIVLMGPNAADSTMQWGNYNGFPKHTVTFREGLERVYRHTKFLSQYAQWDMYLDGGDATLKDRLDAPTVIFIGGISPRLEGEEMPVQQKGFHGGDRTSIELPASQRRMLQQLHDAGHRVIFVNCSGSALALTPELQSCNAIIQAWYPGEEGGTALAEVLSGAVNPSGKLPITFYRDDSQLPDFEDYRMKDRTYRYMQQEPLFAFGYGLSYTTFRVSRPRYADGYVECTVANTGRRDGTEVVQVYVRRTSDVNGPKRALRGFQRVTLKRGERRVIRIPMPRERFETWDESTNAMRVVPGSHELYVGTSSRLQDLKKINVRL